MWLLLQNIVISRYLSMIHFCCRQYYVYSILFAITYFKIICIVSKAFKLPNSFHPQHDVSQGCLDPLRIGIETKTITVSHLYSSLEPCICQRCIGQLLLFGFVKVSLNDLTVSVPSLKESLVVSIMNWIVSIFVRNILFTRLVVAIALSTKLSTIRVYTSLIIIGDVHGVQDKE